LALFLEHIDGGDGKGALKIKALQPKVSNRAIAKALGVGETTVRRDA
jgi:hypothetical protein